MPRVRPQLSITLPRNFTFHYTEGEGPKTPEHEAAPPNPPSPKAYRIKRRPRPTIINPQTHNQMNADLGLEDIPIPTIEVPDPEEHVRPPLQQRATEPADGYLAPAPSRRFMTAPRTPSAQLDQFRLGWDKSDPVFLGENIIRPMSSCSLMSDSSDSSEGSSVSYRSHGGSCTSPESDAPDPFRLPLTEKGKDPLAPRVNMNNPSPKQKHPRKKSKAPWTPEMDKHLWSIYLSYLQDPTVTPFKLLPGTVPPLGVCHRVARQARRTWKGPRTAQGVLVESTPKATGGKCSDETKHAGSPDTVKSSRSGSSTPTGSLLPKLPAWPRSGASTRRRLRELSKRKPALAPHYQRLLQTRSPSPFSSSSRAGSRQARLASPFDMAHHLGSINTRDIQIALATSTAVSMQPQAPLAQLARDEPNSQQSDTWFNDLTDPASTPLPLNSDDTQTSDTMEVVSDLPHLGSPFGYHTWGPSRSRQHLRPSTPRTYSDNHTAPEPTLLSPVQFATLPHASLLKRRAQNQLEDELSPGGSAVRRSFLENLFASPAESTHRRVRSRGFSLGDVNGGSHLTSLFTPPSTDQPMMSSDGHEILAIDASSLIPPSPTLESLSRLGSPIHVNERAPLHSSGGLRSSRHMPEASLHSWNSGTYTSIDQMLRDMDHSDNANKQ